MGAEIPGKARCWLLFSARTFHVKRSKGYANNQWSGSRLIVTPIGCVSGGDTRKGQVVAGVFDGNVSRETSPLCQFSSGERNAQGFRREPSDTPPRRHYGMPPIAVYKLAKFPACGSVTSRRAAVRSWHQIYASHREDLQIASFVEVRMETLKRDHRTTTVRRIFKCPEEAEFIELWTKVTSY